MKYFRKSEFSCPCCGRNEIDTDFTEKLDSARQLADTPFVINSGFRCEKRNKEVGGKPESSHLKGLACDIRAPVSPARYKILKALFAMGFRRIGIAKNFIHVDNDESLPQEVVWIYN